MPVDRTRRFVLPGIQDLNKDQDEVLALPLEGQHLVIGGPGTGKSVVALLRARRLATEEKSYQFLVYNNLLNYSNRHLFDSTELLNSNTWERWFRDTYKSIFYEAIPTIPNQKHHTYEPIDWEAVEKATEIKEIKELPLNASHFLLIDEGQDMPPNFYSSIVGWGLENFYVVADQNQQLDPEKCSSRQNIENALAISPTHTLELKINYRNTRPIAQLAQHFYPGDIASPRPKLPDPKPTATSPELWTYGDIGQQSLDEIVGRILKLSDRFPNKLIGVIAPDNKIREKFFNAIGKANPPLDNGRPPIQTFFSGNQDMLDFGNGGIMIINAQSCKGLEFDFVILADIDEHRPKNYLYALKSRFYVMVARGRDQVILLRTGNICPVVESLLPTDPNILVRKV